MLFMILKLTSVARGHEYMAFLVDVLSEIIVDILPLMSIVIFIVIVFAYALMLLMPDSTDEVDELAIADYNGALMTMYTVWNMLMLGSFERPYTAPHLTVRALMRAAIFLIVSFLVSVVVLNALIALMGDSWERVQANALTRGARGRGRLIVEMQQIMWRKPPDLFPDFVHVLRRKEAVVKASDSEWTGRVTKLMDHTDRKQEEVKAEVESVKAEVNAKVESVNAKVELAIQKMKQLVSMSLQSQQEVNEQLRVLSDRSGRGKSAKQPATTIPRLEA